MANWYLQLPSRFVAGYRQLQSLADRTLHAERDTIEPGMSRRRADAAIAHHEAVRQELVEYQAVYTRRVAAYMRKQSRQAKIPATTQAVTQLRRIGRTLDTIASIMVKQANLETAQYAIVHTDDEDEEEFPDVETAGRREESVGGGDTMEVDR
ncbi:hypothetical protein GP486_008291 [Trichoglossum hirsutum]|uniref:Uncharacterized protein n=1 Tax=Trichoglossum hirsutum TaxID=265104 RepID=A0A9P8L6F1_9PEZI|nr:hypothetical protein GP486_008291 [Trichoglossum hirsutum]